MQDGLGLTILKVLLLALIVFFVGLNTYQISTIEDRIKSAGKSAPAADEPKSAAAGPRSPINSGAPNTAAGTETPVSPLPGGAVRANGGVIILPNGIVIIPEASSPKIIYPETLRPAQSGPSGASISDNTATGATSGSANANSNAPK